MFMAYYFLSGIIDNSMLAGVSIFTVRSNDYVF